MKLRILLLAGALALGGCATIANESAPLAPVQWAQLGTAEARTAAAIRRIDALNPRINAVIAVEPSAMDQARSLDRNNMPRGPIFGMPILVKDNIETIGTLPTTAGSLALKNNVTNRDAPLVANLRAAGAVIVGKANLSEWANIRDNDSISGWSAVGGQTRNPHALNRNTCGSSSGSAAAVAAGMVPAAIGTETDGSVTCPAAVTGIVGFKPTVGLVSRTFVVPISHSQDTPGPFARTVREAAMVLSAMAGSDPADPATVEANRRKVDYAAGLSMDSLRGKRIGVMHYASGFGTDPAWTKRWPCCARRARPWWNVKEFPGRREIGQNEHPVLMSELRLL